MRKFLTALILGTMMASAAPALADDHDGRRDERAERRDDRRDARDERRDDRYDRREDRRDDRYDRRDDWRGYAYRSYGASSWNRQWTPYGFGYNDAFARDWVLRNFADRNRNGRISEKEWRRAQTAFYRLADRNRDGYITRFEYDWALRTLHSNYAYGYRR